jgi:hypothetical protein
MRCPRVNSDRPHPVLFGTGAGADSQFDG